MPHHAADIEPADIAPEVMEQLLRDHTTQSNIFWATGDYAHLGAGYQYSDQITAGSITGMNSDLIKPRAVKSREQQQQRSRDMAEVFTPSWICNKQNNLIDNAWFGRENVFNTEVDSPDGSHSWISTVGKVTFPEGRTWHEYVCENRMEITCGEAPYLVSRYDTVTGDAIPTERRIGLLDRKLRIVGENTETTGEWLKAAQSAYMSTYGYEWQGDNIVLARKNLLHTFTDHYRAKFGTEPLSKSVLYIAYIISWNVWQMDGLKGVIPDSCKEERIVMPDLFTGEKEKASPCRGCATGNIRAHNGRYALVKDWGAKKGREKIRFIDLIK